MKKRNYFYMKQGWGAEAIDRVEATLKPRVEDI